MQGLGSPIIPRLGRLHKTPHRGVSAADLQQRRQSKNAGPDVPGSPCWGTRNSGGRTRTDDLQVMNLMGYQLPCPATKVRRRDPLGYHPFQVRPGSAGSFAAPVGGMRSAGPQWYAHTDGTVGPASLDADQRRLNHTPRPPNCQGILDASPVASETESPQRSQSS